MIRIKRTLSKARSLQCPQSCCRRLPVHRSARALLAITPRVTRNVVAACHGGDRLSIRDRCKLQPSAMQRKTVQAQLGQTPLVGSQMRVPGTSRPIASPKADDTACNSASATGGQSPTHACAHNINMSLCSVCGSCAMRGRRQRPRHPPLPGQQSRPRARKKTVMLMIKSIFAK